MKEVIIPKLDNNTEVGIVSWKVGNHDAVKTGQVICEIETLKTVEEIKAEVGGIIHIISKYTNEAPFNIPIAYIVNNEGELSSIIE